MLISEQKISFSSVNYKVKLYENYSGLAEELLKIKDISSIAIITEKKIASIYGREVEAELTKTGIPFHFHFITGGEKNKHVDRLKPIYNQLIHNKLDRNSVILALGGGVIGDFSGFIAASFLRGIRFIQLPTTLLAAVDSSVGGKVAVNADKGKNMIGFFHQPTLVFAALHTLSTLDRQEWRCGFAEVIKHALLSGGKLYQEILHFRKSDFQPGSELIQLAIQESVKFKADIVKKDEKENGIRSILNLGHTLGHAIESATSYRKYSHGEAIAIGLITALMLSESIYSLDPGILEAILKLYKRISMPYKETIPADKIIQHMKHDKKRKQGKTQFVLLEELAKPNWGNEIQEKQIHDIIQSQWKLD